MRTYFSNLVQKNNIVKITLVVAILIFSIQSFFYYFPSFSVEVDSFANAIRSAKTLAYTSGSTVEFAIEDDGKSYRITCISKDCPHSLDGAQRLSWFTRAQGDKLIFNSNGEPLNSEKKPYFDSTIYVLSRSNNIARVSVSGLTGWIKILD